MSQSASTDRTLPIEEVLGDLRTALKTHGRAVLQAPPGAGKTTRVPLDLLAEGRIKGRIVMLEPRRLAARASAERMAEMLGEPVGQTVGYRVRGTSKVSSKTRIEVITEGILTRRLQNDPELSGTGIVIFDEFHERALQADLGLALSWEVAGALRDDLEILVMSATLDAEPVAALLDNAPIITSAGKAFEVTTHWLDVPTPPRQRLAEACTDLVVKACSETTGGVLVFLPGAGEIRQVASALSYRLPETCNILPLYGALSPAAQRAAITPTKTGRKVVLATSIAETSLTIQDIRVVVDAGLSRRARYDPGSGMSRLVTETVTRAEATQRRGRAGRVAQGDCYRLWTKGAEGAMSAFPPPEIAAADLTGFALDLAGWGAAPHDLALLTQPPHGAFAEARSLLSDMGALEPNGQLTEHGKALSTVPLHPRLAHMLILAGPQSAPLAALLNDRDPLRGASVDLALRLSALKGRHVDAKGVDKDTLFRIKSEAKRLSGGAKHPAQAYSEPEMLALAYPDRIAMRRPGDDPRWLLSGGKGAVMSPEDPLAGQRLLVAAELDGNPRDAKIRLAMPISEAEVRRVFSSQIRSEKLCIWSRRDKQVRARIQEKLGAVVLSDQLWRDASPEARAIAALDGVRHLGLQALRRDKGFDLLRARILLVRTNNPNLPDPNDAALLEVAEDWLLPWLQTIRTEADLRAFDPTEALRAWLGYEALSLLDKETPSHFTTPLGRRISIDYSAPDPEISLRLQEMFGVTRHPTVAGRPLRVTLLSPARRPVQTTMDIPGFWSGSYADVRKDMRARYPRHPWPEDPTVADPTLRVKPRS